MKLQTKVYMMLAMLCTLLLASLVYAQTATTYEIPVDDKTREYVISKATSEKITETEAAQKIFVDSITKEARLDNTRRVEKALMIIRKDPEKMANIIGCLEAEANK